MNNFVFKSLHKKKLLTDFVAKSLLIQSLAANIHLPDGRQFA